MIQVEQHGAITSVRMARSFLGKPLYWTTAYWVDGLLIDSGPRCAAPELLRILKQVPVEQIVLTHGHEDNIGGLAALAACYPGIPIYASPRTISLIQDPTSLKLRFYQRFTWGVPEAVQNITSLDAIGNELRTAHHSFRTLDTPGHSRDHVSVFEPQYHWLFCGDAFIGGREQSCTEEFDLLTSIGTLHTLLSLRPDRLFPASGNVRRSAQAEISEKIEYFRWLIAEVARLEATGQTVEQSVTALFKEEPSITFWTNGHHSAANLIKACRAYNAFFVVKDAAPPAPPIDSFEDHSAEILSQLGDIFANFDNKSTGSKPPKEPPSGKESTDPEDRKR